MKFYCYNSQEGMKLYETLEAAKQAAIEATKRAASTLADPEATANLWGEVHGCAFVEFVCDIDGGMVAACSVVDCHLASDAETERLRAELEALQAELEAVREAWAEVRGLAFTFVESEPYGNEATSLILDTMDSMVPEWAGEAQAPPPAAPAPKPPYVTPPSPTPAPPQWRWEKEEEYQNGAWRVRGTMTHLPSGVSDTSNWWLETGDAQAEAEQGVRNKLARRRS